MNKYQLKKQSMEKEVNKYERIKLQRKGEDKPIELTDEIKPGLKPIVYKSIKQQFNDDSNQCLYGLIQLLLDKQFITNEEYLKYCLHIQSKTNK